MRGLAVFLLLLGSLFGFKAVQALRHGKGMFRGTMVHRHGRANWPVEFWFWVTLSGFVACMTIAAGAYMLILAPDAQ